MCRAHTTNPFFVKHLMIVHLAITNYNLGRKKVYTLKSPKYLYSKTKMGHAVIALLKVQFF